MIIENIRKGGVFMEEIYKNIFSPEWWFNGFFFILVGLVIPSIFMKLIPLLGGFFIVKPFRKIRAIRLKKIKRIRWDPVKISYETSTSASLLGAFITSSVLYLTSISMSVVVLSYRDDVNNILEYDIFFIMTNCLMIFIILIEILYFTKRLFVQSLLLRRDRIFRTARINKYLKKGF